MNRAILPVLLFVSSLSAAQIIQKSAQGNQDLTPQQTQAIVKLANLQKNFGKSMNSPGVDVVLKEVSRARSSDRTLVKYELYTTGLPNDQVYTLFQVQINGSVLKLLEGVTLDGQGRAICAGRKGTCTGAGPNDPVDLVFYAGKSEPKRISIISNDEPHLKGFISVIPFPNSTTDGGCRLESILGMPKGEVTYIQGAGFAPGEELTVDTESYAEKIHSVDHAEADGSYFATTLPNVLAKKAGTTVWSVRGKNCHPSLTFSWGTYQVE